MRHVAVALAVALGVSCGSAGGSAPSPLSTPIPGAVVITRASDHGTLHARVGDTIQVALGADYDWHLDPPDGVLLVQGVQRYLLVRGTQAIWTAAAPGTATVTATGSIICPSGQACILLALVFTTTVVVAP